LFRKDSFLIAMGVRIVWTNRGVATGNISSGRFQLATFCPTCAGLVRFSDCFELFL
jgi:hypothetical protein